MKRSVKFVLTVTPASRRSRRLNHVDLDALKASILTLLPEVAPERVTLLEISQTEVEVDVSVDDRAGTKTDSIQAAINEPTFVQQIKAANPGLAEVFIRTPPYIANPEVLEAPANPPPPPPPTLPETGTPVGGNATEDGLETTDGQEQAQSEDLNIGAVAAIAVLVPLLICCLLCIMYFALRRKKSKEIYSATVMLMELAKSSIRSSRASRNSKSKLLEVTKGDDSKGQSQDLDASDDEADPEDVVPELPEPEPQPVAQSRLHRI